MLFASAGVPSGIVYLVWITSRKCGLWAYVLAIRTGRTGWLVSCLEEDQLLARLGEMNSLSSLPIRRRPRAGSSNLTNPYPSAATVSYWTH